MKSWKDLLPGEDEFSITPLSDADAEKAAALKSLMAAFMRDCPENPERGTVGFAFKEAVRVANRKFLDDVLGEVRSYTGGL